MESPHCTPTLISLAEHVFQCHRGIYTPWPGLGVKGKRWWNGYSAVTIWNWWQLAEVPGDNELA